MATECCRKLREKQRHKRQGHKTVSRRDTSTRSEHTAHRARATVVVLATIKIDYRPLFDFISMRASSRARAQLCVSIKSPLGDHQHNKNGQGREREGERLSGYRAPSKIIVRLLDFDWPPWIPKYRTKDMFPKWPCSTRPNMPWPLHRQWHHQRSISLRCRRVASWTESGHSGGLVVVCN